MIVIHQLFYMHLVNDSYFNFSWLINYNIVSSAPGWDPNKALLVLSMFCLWAWITFVVGTVYRSNLTSMIILQKRRIPFETLEQLVNQKEFKYITAGGGVVMQMASVRVRFSHTRYTG